MTRDGLALLAVEYHPLSQTAKQFPLSIQSIPILLFYLGDVYEYFNRFIKKVGGFNFHIHIHETFIIHSGYIFFVNSSDISIHSLHNIILQY